MTVQYCMVERGLVESGVVCSSPHYTTLHYTMLHYSILLYCTLHYTLLYSDINSKYKSNDKFDMTMSTATSTIVSAYISMTIAATGVTMYFTAIYCNTPHETALH